MFNVPTTTELRSARQTNAFCQHAAKLIDTDPRFTFDDYGLDCRKAPVDGVLQLVVLQLHQQAVFYFCHLTNLADHPGTRGLYDNLRKGSCWPQIATNVYNYLEQCGLCRRHGSSNTHRTWLQLFSQSRPFGFNAIKSFWPRDQDLAGELV